MKAESKGYLLDDAAMRRFIVDGFVKVRADYPASFHEVIYNKLEEVFEKEGNIGNNVLPRIPEIQRIFEHPAVRGALTSILGSDYIMNPHRHPHFNKPGSGGQQWHKGIEALANLTSAIGDPDETVRSEAAISIGKIRPVTNAVRSPLMDAMEDSSETVRLNAAYGLGGTGETVVPALIGALRVEAMKTEEEAMAKTPANLHRTNPNACCSAQALSAVGTPAVLALVGALEEPHWWIRTLAANTLGNIGPQADKAVPALVDLLKDEHWWVRRNAAEALGRIGSKAAVPALIHSLLDPDWRVRGNAALSLAKSSQPNNDAIPNLILILADENRYNRFYASLALSRLGTTEAREALINDLFTSRWCPITTNKTPY